MDEYIKREAAVAVCDEQYKECLRKSDFCGDTVAWNICAGIRAIPAADVAPVVHGRWVGSKYDPETGDYMEKCSHCGVFSREYWKPHCSECGALMDGGDSDEAD